VGARGPKPSENSVTRHKPKQRKRNMEAVAPGVPELPVDDPHPLTVVRWDAWVASPQAAFFAATDWQTLIGLSFVWDLFYKAPDSKLHSEIRQMEAKLGATASDRDRLGWKIEPPEPVSAAPARGSRSRPDPRAKGADA